MPYGTADLAGAIVGSIIGAALITFLMTYLIFSRRKQSRDSSPSRKRDESSATRRKDSKGLAAVGEKRVGRSNNSDLDWQAYLPDSADDRSIQNAVKTLLNQVELHVDNYYRKANVDLDTEPRQALSEVDSGQLPGPIDGLMLNSRVALPTIKHCVANTLIAEMTPGSSPAGSLLPAYLASAPSKLPTSSKAPGEELGQYSRSYALQRYLLTLICISCTSSI